MLCIFVIRKPHYKPFTWFSRPCLLFLCWKCQLVSSNLTLFSPWLCMEYIWTAASARVPVSVIILNDVWTAGGPGNLLRHIPTILIFYTHTYPQINNMSVWFMVAETQWRSSVYVRFFFFCLSISNTQSLLLSSETELMWFSASLTDNNTLSHYLLHPKKAATM